MWQQICQIQAVIVVIFRDSGEDIGEPLLWINITGLTASKKGVHNGSILSRIMVAAEQIVFSSESQGADSIFSQVIIDLITSVQMVPG